MRPFLAEAPEGFSWLLESEAACCCTDADGAYGMCRRRMTAIALSRPWPYTGGQLGTRDCTP